MTQWTQYYDRPMPTIENRKPHSFHLSDVKWIELSEKEANLPWPDRVRAKGRPRAVKCGHIVHVVRYGVQARVAGSDRFYGPPFAPVYRAPNKATVTKALYRFRAECAKMLPAGQWWSYIHLDESIGPEKGWYYLMLGYTPPDDIEFLRGTWGLDSTWLNGMLAEWHKKEAAEDEKFYAENPEIAEFEAELLKDMGIEPPE